MALISLCSLPAWQEARLTPQGGDLSDYYCPDRCGHSAVCIKDELLIWGGYNERDTGSMYCDKHVLWNYNLDLDTWVRVKTGGQIPQYRSGACSALVWPYWYIFSGHTFEGDVNDVYRLDLIHLTWERVEVKGQDLSPRDKASSWAYNNGVYCFGGYGTVPYDYLWDKEEDSFSLEFMNGRGWNDQVLYFDLDKKTWTRLSCKGPKPKGRAAHSTVCVDHMVYLFGGRHQTQRMNDLHCLNLLSHTWSGSISCLGSLPEGRSWHSMSPITKTELLLFGGFNNDNIPLDDVWLLNVTTFTWTQIRARTGLPRLWHTACVNASGDVLVFGGCVNNILDDSTVMVTSDKVVLFKLQPFTLERLCLHAVFKHRELTSGQWEMLPRPLQQWLNQKCQVQVRPPFYKTNVETGMGPNTDQLTVMTSTQANALNTLSGNSSYIDYFSLH